MSTPPQAPYDPRQGDPVAGKPWLRWVIVGCGALLFGVVALGLTIALVVRGATAGPERVVKAFLAAVEAEDFDAAHAHFSAPLKEAQPLPELVAMASANRYLFEVRDTTFNERSVDLGGAALTGSVTLASGTKIPASFRLAKEAGQWKLVAYELGQ